MGQQCYKCQSCDFGPCYVSVPTREIQNGSIFEPESYAFPNVCPNELEEFARFKGIPIPNGPEAVDALIDWINGPAYDTADQFVIDCVQQTGIFALMANGAIYKIWELFSIREQPDKYDLPEEEFNKILKRYSKKQIFKSVFFYAFSAGVLFYDRMRRDPDFAAQYEPTDGRY